MGLHGAMHEISSFALPCLYVLAVSPSPCDWIFIVTSSYGFVLRIVLLLVVAWMTLLVFNSALIVVPISLGRAIFNAIPLLPITHGIKCNGMQLIPLVSIVSMFHSF